MNVFAATPGALSHRSPVAHPLAWLLAEKEGHPVGLLDLATLRAGDAAVAARLAALAA